MWAQLVENGAAVCHGGSFVLQGCNPWRKCFSFISQFFEGAQSLLLIFEAWGYEMQSAAQQLPEDTVLMCSHPRKLSMVNCTLFLFVISSTLALTESTSKQAWGRFPWYREAEWRSRSSRNQRGNQQYWSGK